MKAVLKSKTRWRRALRSVKISLAAVVLAACGYAPIADLTSGFIAQDVFVESKISLQDPQNSVALKDAISNAVTHKLRRQIVPKELSQTQIVASLNSLTFTPVIYDSKGFITTYKAIVSITYEVTNGEQRRRFTTSGEYSFTPTRQSTSFSTSSLSENERYNAILKASEDSFDDFISLLAVNSMVKESK